VVNIEQYTHKTNIKPINAGTVNTKVDYNKDEITLHENERKKKMTRITPRLKQNTKKNKPRIMTYGEKINWDNIKTNEIFMATGCCLICMKINKNSIHVIANDYNSIMFNEYDIAHLYQIDHRKFYRLPKRVQALWKCE